MNVTTQIELHKSEIIDFVQNYFEKDLMTMEHSIDVYNLVLKLYRNLPKSLKAAINKESLLNAAILHDVGKLFIPDSIINKPSALDLTEREIVKCHAAKGKMMLAITKYKEIADIVCYHHERVDGTGYFDLDKAQIPLESKLIAIADTYSALTKDRAYRKHCSIDNALKILISVSGTQLDEYLVDIFCQVA